MDPSNRQMLGLTQTRSAASTLLLSLSLTLGGCAQAPEGRMAFEFPWMTKQAEQTCAVDAAMAEVEQAALFRRAETERAEQLSLEIDRLQADLRTAEQALVEVESGLAGSNSRADAVSSLAVTRIQVERAASRAPWRNLEIAGAREKLEEAERQVAEGRFGAAIFYAYRARRVAESVLDEAKQVMRSGKARLIRAKRVNLRAGPSTDQRVLSVLVAGMPVVPQTTEGEWTLVQVTGGPAGWIHGSLLGNRITESTELPAAPTP